MTGDCSGPTFSTSLMFHLSWAVPFPRFRLSLCTPAPTRLCGSTLCTMRRSIEKLLFNNVLPTESNAGPFPSPLTLS